MFMSKIMYNGKEYPQNAPYKEFVGILVAGQSTIIFTDSAINTNRTIKCYTGEYKVHPVKIIVGTGTITLIFNPYNTDVTVKVRIS